MDEKVITAVIVSGLMLMGYSAGRAVSEAKLEAKEAENSKLRFTLKISTDLNESMLKIIENRETGSEKSE